MSLKRLYHSEQFRESVVKVLLMPTVRSSPINYFVIELVSHLTITADQQWRYCNGEDITFYSSFKIIWPRFCFLWSKFLNFYFCLWKDSAAWVWVTGHQSFGIFLRLPYNLAASTLPYQKQVLFWLEPRVVLNFIIVESKTSPILPRI